MSAKKRVLLVILDGFGIREEKDFNAVLNANMPNWNHYIKNYAFSKIDASNEAVGLPHGQFGNSEVGHLNIGAGRVVMQDITRIDASIKSREFFTNPALTKAINTTPSGNVHILGLVSDGGVHSEIKHIFALIELASLNPALQNIWLHVFLDGRDTPPQSAAKYLTELQEYLVKFPKAKVATVSGRYYAMDRDKRYDRLELAYNAIIFAKSEINATNVMQALTDSYANNEFDEFVKPCVMYGYTGFASGDSVIFANFRSDRAIQLTDAIINAQFTQFKRSEIKLSNFVTMTQYDAKFNVDVAFAPQVIKNTLGEYLANCGLTQLRIAETEKYPHVTYFLNGGRTEPYPLEERILVDSPRDVATYDLKPEMSLPEVADNLVKAINSEKYDFIITNFANADMVGHTGNLVAAITAVEAIDSALGKVIQALQEHDGEALIIADHGNCEEMYDYQSRQPHTQHTTNLVPCLYIGRKARIKPAGALKDVAPTLLTMAGINTPQEMNGMNLIEFI